MLLKILSLIDMSPSKAARSGIVTNETWRQSLIRQVLYKALHPKTSTHEPTVREFPVESPLEPAGPQCVCMPIAM